jgi:transposase-like protein
MGALDMKNLPPDTVAALVALRDALLAAQHGQAGSMVQAAAAQHGCSVQSLYRWLAKHAGYKPARKLRRDAGSTKVSPEVLEFVAAAKREGMRGNGKEILPTNVALNIAAANGMAVNASADTINRQLRQRRMQPAQVGSQRATISMQSEHPNHVHQVDPSLCVLYYMGGKQRMMTEQAFNKNKPGNYVKIKLKVWRYVRYDHASARIDVRYYEAAGENQQTLFEFLLWTWGQQEGRLCHGLPRLLYWDGGSERNSPAVCRFLNAVGVQHEAHAPGHAWAKGGVENANNIVETQFESRLRFEPVDTVEQLNAAALAWARDYNANQLAHIDSRVVRASGEPLVRDDSWSRIAHYPGALVALPPREVCAWFLSGREETRQVVNNTISFVHPELGQSRPYDLSAWASHLGHKVKLRVTPLLLQGGRVRLELERFGQEPLVFEANPETEFNAYGQRADGPTFGQEHQRAAKSGDELQADHLAAVAWGKGTNAEAAEKLREQSKRPFAAANEGKGLVAHGHLGKETVTRLLPAAAEADTPALAAQAVQAPRVQVMLSVPEAVRAIKERLGAAAPADLYSQLKAAYPAGHVPQDWADHWGQAPAATGTHDGAASGLRRVK